MVTRRASLRQLPAWRRELAQAVSDPGELLSLLHLDRALLPGARRAAKRFPLRVPRGYVARMTPGDPNDPLLRQVLPLEAELRDTPGFGTDPVGDLSAMVDCGVLQKYSGRALLVTTGACAVHCRYCFRRHFPYSAANPAADQWRSVLEYLESNATLEEVILSGGDPLCLPDERLSALLALLEKIPHLRRLRIHSRLPVVVPARVDKPLLTWLGDTRLHTVLVIHANHPHEIDPQVTQALHHLKEAGVCLLNQSVLLRGVNDNAQTLKRLSQTLFEAHTLPYYLHLLDKVQGAAHFDLPLPQALALMEDLQKALPGYLVPRLVREHGGAPYKTLVSP